MLKRSHAAPKDNPPVDPAPLGPKKRSPLEIAIVIALAVVGISIIAGIVFLLLVISALTKG